MSVNAVNPTLSPKPPHGPPSYSGPPSYREPPNPPIRLTAQSPVHLSQPDVCTFASAKPQNITEAEHDNNGENVTISTSQPLSSSFKAECNNTLPENCPPSFSGNQAWAEVKGNGNMVGERLNTLQKKLRSLLTQTQRKTGVESQVKSCSPSESQELSHFSTGDVIQTTSPSSSSAFFASIERHPFETEVEEARDTTHIRDTCTKFFSRDPKAYSSQLNQISNFYTNNIKSTFDHDKLVPKEVIGKSCHIKKDLSSSNIAVKTIQNSNLVKSAEDLARETKPLSSYESDRGAFSLKAFCCNENPSQDSLQNQTLPHSDAQITDRQCSVRTDTRPIEIDCGDISDHYKSSSESGHGTMHSCNGRDNKSLASAYSGKVSRYSHLDTSMDSDGANCYLWSGACKNEPDKVQSGTKKSLRCETACASEIVQHSPIRHLDKSDFKQLSAVGNEPTLLLPTAPPPRGNSPHYSTKDTYTSLQSMTLKNDHSIPYDSEINDSDDSEQKDESSFLPKSTSCRKNTTKKPVNSAPVSYRHRNGKSKDQKSISSAHKSLYSNRKMPHSFSRQPLVVPSYDDPGEQEWTSTTTGLDGESFVDDNDLSSNFSMSTSTMDPLEISMIRRQLEGLENMYFEVLHILGSKNNSRGISHTSGHPLDFKHSKFRMDGSISSMTGRNSIPPGSHVFPDKRVLFEKRRGKDIKQGSAKRLQRLESHVVTLARSVAHLSSEMRTQHMFVQELEHMRRDLTCVHERLQLLQLAHGSPMTHLNKDKSRNLPLPRSLDYSSNEFNELLNPNRAKKLTKFFGDEPPLIRQFLKHLGYEKYASQLESEKIGIMELPYITEDRLQKLGVPMGPRIRIIQEAHSYFQQNHYKVYIV